MTIEPIILIIYQHYKTKKMRNKSKTKHVEKKKKISTNKNNNFNGNNNDLKDEQNNRFEKKETLI